ncbi:MULTISPECIES: hypothetical protein [unclassified Leptolyngbya]|uniref:hypothetical protein n=1 Tax=unclassified Leptolyngbya TaxID=2650499 RepID=UPI00168241E1|nr:MULTISPECIES: hypothetical protein [unclassified Leptolyngbya]MBD1909982.1 hypothetical protein [Leptolyngbya sp. FACHB-8]MBD2155195.1 hypothetical protein [Leptolyngbya sp. FACHB-16]
MTLFICPGVHDPALTQAFLTGLGLAPETVAVFPASQEEPYSPLAVLTFFRRSLPHPHSAPPLQIIAFSAGVVGAMGAAHLWQMQGGQIAYLIALDGWGVPAWANFPIYRLSHDRFTHWSSQVTGSSTLNFYADPAVEHLELWRSPQQTSGWRTSGWGLRSHTTAAVFIHEILTQTSQ